MKRTNAFMLLLALAAIGIFALGGCGDDDGVAPHETPTVTAADAAGQAGFIAMSLTDVLDDLVSKAVPDQRWVSLDCVYGSYWKDDDPNDRVYTDVDNVLTVDFDCDGMQDEVDNGTVTFDITSIAGQANGTGALVIDALTVTFEIEDVEIGPDNKPEAGQLIVDSSGYTAVIAFTGGNTAVVTVAGEGSWLVDLNDGSITEL